MEFILTCFTEATVHICWNLIPGQWAVTHRILTVRPRRSRLRLSWRSVWLETRAVMQELKVATGETEESAVWLYWRLFDRADRETRFCRCRNSGDDGFDFSVGPSPRYRRKMFANCREQKDKLLFYGLTSVALWFKIDSKRERDKGLKIIVYFYDFQNNKTVISLPGGVHNMAARRGIGGAVEVGGQDRELCAEN